MLYGICGQQHEKTCLREFANNTGTDQPAQTDQRLCYSLFESTICKLATGEISIFYLVSVAEETGLKLAL